LQKLLLNFTTQPQSISTTKHKKRRPQFSTAIVYYFNILPIANLLDALYFRDSNSKGFSLSDKSKEIIKTYLYDNTELDKENLTKVLYTELYKLNNLEQAQTYPKDNLDINIVPKHTPSYWEIRNDIKLNEEIQAYKSIQCYLYNSITEHPLIDVVKEVLESLGDKIITNQEAYKNAK